VARLRLGGAQWAFAAYTALPEAGIFHKVDRRSWFPAVSAFAVVAMVLGPIVAFLVVSYRQAVANVESELRYVASTSIARTEAILTNVKAELEQLAKQGHIGCRDVDRAAFLEVIYRRVEVRSIGVFDPTRRLFFCTENRVFEPALFMSRDVDTQVNGMGEIFVTPTETDLNGLNSIFVNSRQPGGHAFSAAIYPEQFWDFQQYLGLGDVEGLFLANRDGVHLTGSGAYRFAAAPTDLQSTTSVVLSNGSYYATAHSTRFPLFTVAVASQNSVLRQWRTNALSFLAAGLILSSLGAYCARRLASRGIPLEDDLRDALRHRSISVRYQPIVDLRTSLVIGAEVLARWQHPIRGAVPPDVFVPLAERHGLLPQLTVVVFERVLAEQAALMQKFPKVRFSINLGRDDLQRDGLFDRCLKRHADMLKHFQVEVTERESLDASSVEVATLLKSWRELGLRVALDDFGTGYANLSYLHAFPFDALKVDRSFTAGIDTEHGAKLFGVISQIAASFKFAVIVEGVERAAQRDFLSAQGVHEAQGWFFAKDESAEAFRTRIERQAADEPQGTLAP
jgi:sensor c-di-GMP phosphodiesterase-like protein